MDMYRIEIVVEGTKEKAQLLLEDVLALAGPIEGIMGLKIVASAVIDADAGLNDAPASDPAETLKFPAVESRD
jgi:hypothetical protein